MPRTIRLATAAVVLTACAALVAWAGPARAQPRNKTIYSFRGGADGIGLYISAPTPDASGNLYGFDASGGLPNCKILGAEGRCGTIFRLHPQAASGPPWVKETLYSFTGGADGLEPNLYSKPLVDALGNIYGLADSSLSGVYRTIFELSPPSVPGGAWTFQTLHALTGGADGANADAGLVMDASGTLYGTAFDGGAHNKGVVDPLTPPPAGGTAWTETVLYSFGSRTDDATQPFTPVALSANGSALFGTTAYVGGKGCGAVYRLRRAGSAWKEAILYRFTCGADGATPSDVLVGRNNNLFGMTVQGGANNDGTVFELSPPAAGQTAWTEQVLHSFAGPDGANPTSTVVAVRGINALFGVTSNGGSGPAGGVGTVFRLDPPASGSGAWALTTLQSFTGSAQAPGPAAYPTFLTAGRHRLLFGVARDGGTHGVGAIFSQTPE